MNEYYNNNSMYERIVQTAAMITALTAFTIVYDNNTFEKINTDNSDRSNLRPTIEAILLSKEKLTVYSCDAINKKSSNSLKRNYGLDALTKKYNNKYSKVNTKTNYNRYLNSRY